MVFGDSAQRTLKLTPKQIVDLQGTTVYFRAMSGASIEMRKDASIRSEATEEMVVDKIKEISDIEERIDAFAEQLQNIQDNTDSKITSSVRWLC